MGANLFQVTKDHDAIMQKNAKLNIRPSGYIYEEKAFISWKQQSEDGGSFRHKLLNRHSKQRDGSNHSKQSINSINKMLANQNNFDAASFKSTNS